MPIDREAALKKAEKFLRQGRLDGAIEEYARLVADQPRDWNAINALGDLYVRAGDLDRAVVQFTRVADYLFGEGFLPKAAALYKKALKVQGHHEHTLLRLGEIAARQGLLADARVYWGQLAERRRQRGDEAGAAECLGRIRALEEEAEPAPASASVDHPDEGPDQLLAAARQELAAGRDPQGRALLTRVLMLDTAFHAAVLDVAFDLVRDGRIDSAFGCVEVVADAAVLDGDWPRAVGALETFVAAAPHIPALMKLIDLCVDAGADAQLRATQARLADAYLDAGMGAEARVVAEDLLEREPGSAEHAGRRRRALALLGTPAPDADTREASTGPAGMQEIEVDLSEILSGIGAPPAEAEPSEESYDRGLAHLRAGREDAAIRDLTAATRVPRTRARAAADLGRLYVRRGELQAGVDWLEQAADGPAASPEEAYDVLYDLADALERLGESARALAILVDLDADAAGYRDVRKRIEQLARAQAGSRGR